MAGVAPGSWLDLAGQEVDPFAANGTNAAKATVFIFIKTDCPVSNRYAPEIRRLAQKFGSLGVRFWLVHADPDASVESLRQHTKDYQYSCGVLRDPEQLLVRMCYARVTPQAAIFNADRQLVYHGRIDNRVVALGHERAEPTTHELEESLTFVLAGKKIARASTRAIGCTIPPKH
jgi:hypothetical protein